MVFPKQAYREPIRVSDNKLSKRAYRKPRDTGRTNVGSYLSPKQILSNLAEDRYDEEMRLKRTYGDNAENAEGLFRRMFGQETKGEINKTISGKVSWTYTELPPEFQVGYLIEVGKLGDIYQATAALQKAEKFLKEGKVTEVVGKTNEVKALSPEFIREQTTDLLNKVVIEYQHVADEAKKMGNYHYGVLIEGYSQRLKEYLATRKTKRLNGGLEETLANHNVAASVLSISSFILALFFLSSNLTGLTITQNMAISESNFIGVLLFIVGLIFSFVYLKKSK